MSSAMKRRSILLEEFFDRDAAKRLEIAGTPVPARIK
jgi:hypothetical protein